jgi:hypothetical protein
MSSSLVIAQAWAGIASDAPVGEQNSAIECLSLAWRQVLITEGVAQPDAAMLAGRTASLARDIAAELCAARHQRDR